MLMKRSFMQQITTRFWLLFHKRERNYRYVMLIALANCNSNVILHLQNRNNVDLHFFQLM